MGRPALADDIVQRQTERIRRSALALFTRHSVEAVSMRAIAAEVGMSAMAIYRYFPGGKDEILASLRGRGFEALTAQLAAAHARAAAPIEQIVLATIALVQFSRERPALYRLMFDMTQVEEGERYLTSRREAAWACAAEPFREAIRLGLLEGDPDVLPQLCFALIHGAISFELSRQPDPRRRMSRLIAPALENFLRGAGAAPALIQLLAPLRSAFP
jgi:AcrR family transcriptional regulator